MEARHFVGAIISLRDGHNEPRDWVLLKFLGEGKSGIVYQMAPVSNPSTEMRVVKFPSSDVRFQMTVLHNSFRLAEEMFPEHPQRLTSEERLRRLTDEMLLRIESSGAAFRVKAYRNLLRAAVLALVAHFYEQFRLGTLPASFLDRDDAVTPLIDENLVCQIEFKLDEELPNEIRCFLECCVEDVKRRIDALKTTDSYHPLLQNRFVKLLGLHLEGFLNWGELLIITNSDRFRKECISSEILNFKDAIPFLYYRASEEKQSLEAAREKGESGASSEVVDMILATKATALYFEETAVRYCPSLPYLSGFAKSWLARTLLLSDEKNEAVALLEEALDTLTTDEYPLERFDTLLDLTRLLRDSERDRSNRYGREALEIKERLGITLSS